MTETIFNAVTAYGIWGVMICTYLSCLLVPIPTSLMMLAAGALAAAGDITLAPLLVAAFTGAVLGDQTGYAIGRKAGEWVLPMLEARPSRKAVIARARTTVDRHGDKGVFFSTWLVAPLGPYVNVVAGATRLSWLRFSIADVLGEAIWVNVYVWMGFFFASNVTLLATVMADVIGLLVASVVGLSALMWAVHMVRAQRALAASVDPAAPENRRIHTL